MPGIMPMKIIKVGSSAQSRVAQACDRCRSKKIRCDGITPCCTQCANVGFECKTSDKLSRRAFPRGYTESLEERVRQLEAEVRELKELLDEKDEKIDLLSKFHDFSTSRSRSDTSRTIKTVSQQPSDVVERELDDTFAIKQSNVLVRTSSRTEPHWAGASSSASFLEVFKAKVAESGRAVPSISPRALFPTSDLQHRRPVGGHARRPPRLVSDRLVNVFLQEIAPLFPILYRPAFLQHYREFTDGSDNIEDHHAVARMNLVFSIAATASDFGKEHVSAFDNHWHSALNSIIHDNSLATLQCLVLAQFCCLCKGDSTRILHYAGIAIIMSRRLGLHKSQADLPLDALTTELRKRAFWCLYTLDTFTAAYLGLPRLIKDEIVQTETPIDIDDEDLSEHRLTAVSSETKMSASLALFALAKIFSRVIDNIYQSAAVSRISIQTVAELSDLLDGWRDGLPLHLRLTFSQDKPSTNITGDRSPLLSLTYYHVRALLHRPLAISNLGAKAVPSAMALADSSKHIVQLVQLLDERRMSFALPLSRSETLVTAGLGLLYQGLTITSRSNDRSPTFSSSIVNENQRLVCAIMSILDSGDSPCANDFKSLACALITVDEFRIRRTSSRSNTKSVSPRSSVSQVSQSNSSESLAVSSASSQSPLPRGASMENGDASHGKRSQSTTIAQRRAMAAPGKLRFPKQNIMFTASQQAYKTGLTPTKSEPALRAAAATQSSRQASPHQSQMVETKRSSMMFPTGDLKSLDYLPFGNDTSSMSSLTPIAQRPNAFDGSNAQWDHILGCLSGANASGDPGAVTSPPMEIFSPAHSGIDGGIGVGVPGLTNLDWTGSHDPVSATAWTESTGVPSVFDDSGASLTSGDETRSSIDLGKGGASELQKEIDYLAGASGFDLSTSLTEDFSSLQGLDVSLRI